MALYFPGFAENLSMRASAEALRSHTSSYQCPKQPQRQ